MKTIKLAIADDYKIYREGIKIGLAKDDRIEVLFEADNGEELLAKIKECEPDVIIMDLKMPLLDGLEATKYIREHYPAIKVLVVTMYEDEKFIIHLMEHGANGYLVKNSEPEEIHKAIYSVFETGYYFNDLLNKALLKKLTIRQNIKPTFNNDVDFTERELEVLRLICEEKTAAEIGKEIYLSPRSVEGIRQRLIEKVGVRNSAGLVMFAVKHGIVT